MTKTLFVGGLPAWFTAVHVRALISMQGVDCIALRVRMPEEHGDAADGSRIAYVDCRPGDAERLRTALFGLEVAGRKINCALARGERR
jgi:hypothetical protein